MRYCPSCGSAIEDGEPFCGQCGAQVEQSSFSQSSSEYHEPVSKPIVGHDLSTGMGTVSLALGIISLLLGLLSCVPGCSFLCFFAPAVTIASFVLGFISLSNPAEKPKSTWGIVLSVLSVIVYGVLILVYGIIFILAVVFQNGSG
jgi:hypothetical protein